jgi:hypothetical protein
MKRNRLRSLIAIAAVTVLAGACGTFTPDESGQFVRTDDIKPGPGIFTGESGKWVIFEK